MRLKFRVPRRALLRRHAVAGYVAAGCGLLAACGAGTSVGGLSSDLFGRSPDPARPTTASQIDPSYFEKTEICPQIEVRSGTESLRIYERGGEGDAARVRYQASIGETARDCRNAPGGVNVRVGVSGRVIAGPKGGAGSLTIPLRVAVLKDGKDVIYSKLHKISVTLSPPGLGENFAVVDDQVTFAADPAASYRVFVGFDERGS